MAQGIPNPSIPREGPVAEHVDLSPRASLKRQVDGDVMDDDVAGFVPLCGPFGPVLVLMNVNTA